MLQGHDLNTLGTLFDLVPDGVLLVDAGGRILLANAGIQRIFGHDREALRGADLEKLLPAPKRALHRDHLRDFMRHPESLSLGIDREVRGLCRDGTEVVLEVGLQPTRGADGPLVVATVVDVSVRRARLASRSRAEAAFQELANDAPTILWVSDASGACTFVSRGWHAFTGQHEADALGLGWDAVVHPEDLPEMRHITDQARHARQAFSLDHRLRTASGDYRWAMETGRPRFDESGKFLGHVGSVIDIHDRKRAENALRDSQHQLRQIIDLVPHSIFLKDRDGRYLLLNRAEAEVHGSTVERMLGHLQEEFHGNPVELQQFLRENREIIASGQPVFIPEESFTDNSGQVRVQQTSKVPLVSADGEIRAVLGVAVDITERKRAEERSEYLAYHDPLTGLANRRLLQDRLSQALTGARRESNRLALLLLDIDNFKDVNDILGHPAGDRLLVAVTRRFQGILRGMDSLARLGGDEFAVLQTGLKDASGAASLAAKLIGSLKDPFPMEGQEIHVTASVGIAVFPDHGSGIEELFQHAELALYRAKAAGRNRHACFTPEMTTEARHRKSLETHLRRAIDHGELQLHYQPQLDLRSGGIQGVEALARWPHRELGMIPPGQFIPVAESSGLICGLGEWVLDTACRQARRWQQAGSPLRVAVNLSLAQLRQEDFQERVLEILERHDLDPDLLELEITESLFMDASMLTMTATLERLAARGVHLSLDDFGTGYSSLAYLKRFPVHKIKVDQSFVRDLHNDPEDRAIVEAIIALGDRLGKRVVAEGVENAAQLAFLREQGCDEIQGYFIGRPQPVAQFDAWLADWARHWRRMQETMQRDATATTAPGAAR